MKMSISLDIICKKLEYRIDTAVGYIRGLGRDNLKLDNYVIDNIHDMVGEDISLSKNSALRDYPSAADSIELSMEAQSFQKERMFRRHGKWLEKLYNTALAFEDNLPSLGLSDQTTTKLRWLMHHYEQLTNNKSEYNPIRPVFNSQTLPQIPP